MKDLQDLGVRTDRLVAGLHKRLIETVAEDARLDKRQNKSWKQRRQERLEEERGI